MNDDLIFKASPAIEDFDTEIETSRIYEDKNGRSILEVNNSETSKTLYDLNYLDVISSDGSVVEASLSEKLELIRRSLYESVVNTFKYVFGKSDNEISDLFKMFKVSIELTSEYPYYVSDLHASQIASALNGNSVELYGGWTLKSAESLSEGWDVISWLNSFESKSYGFDRNITAMRTSNEMYKAECISGVGLNLSFEPSNVEAGKQGNTFDVIFEIYTGDVAETHVCSSTNDTYTIVNRFNISANQLILDNVDFTFSVSAIEENAFDKYNIVVSLYDNEGTYTVTNGKLTEKIISDTVREYTIKKEDIDDTLYFIGCLAK